MAKVSDPGRILTPSTEEEAALWSKRLVYARPAIRTLLLVEPRDETGNALGAALAIATRDEAAALACLAMLVEATDPGLIPPAFILAHTAVALVSLDAIRFGPAAAQALRDVLDSEVLVPGPMLRRIQQVASAVRGSEGEALRCSLASRMFAAGLFNEVLAREPQLPNM